MENTEKIESSNIETDQPKDKDNDPIMKFRI